MNYICINIKNNNDSLLEGALSLACFGFSNLPYTCYWCEQHDLRS